MPTLVKTQFENLAVIPASEMGSPEAFRMAVLKDFWICAVSREVSITGRREVLSGKAKFGIMGDGKELPQVVLARFFDKGDFRSGYYRDQTLVMGLGVCSVDDCFSQLYADVENDSFSGGRQMNNHFATPFVDANDNFLDLKKTINISSDISSTGGQMARALGLALASKKLKQNTAARLANPNLGNGTEVVFCTIGDASTSEGVFWETLNAAAVQEVPLVVSVWDDGYGISVPRELQTAKSSISLAASGFEIDETNNGIYILRVNGWDYVGLNNTYEQAVNIARRYHKPVLVHVEELTQPQGHSTSGSHERYKSEDRLQWERSHDCILKMKEWMILAGISDQDEITELETHAKAFAKAGKQKAWAAYFTPIDAFKKSVLEVLKESGDLFSETIKEIKGFYNPGRFEVVRAIRQLQHHCLVKNLPVPTKLSTIVADELRYADSAYHSHLYSHASSAAIQASVIHPTYDAEPELLSGYQIINAFFDQLFGKNPYVYAFGEDVGGIGDVNQGFAGLQEKYGKDRVYDTGIREWTIVGQAIGLAMRGLRPIAEIQYLDYLVYGLPALTDDLATIRYRSAGIQIAPAIIRTRGHRLEGIWHSGSQMGMMLSSLRGIYICVPRNFTQAAGIYNTLLQSTDPAIVIEPLNAYRQKEALPSNMGTYTVALGSPEILKSGNSLSIVTYGSCVPIVLKAADILSVAGIEVEVIDVQTLLPFDLEHTIGASLSKTSRLLIVDEDLPGAASAFMLQQILEVQNGYFTLDSQPITLTAKEHRPPYGDEGDYYTKPQVEDVVDAVVKIIQEVNPGIFKHN